jgi:hypothetical protein
MSKGSKSSQHLQKQRKTKRGRSSARGPSTSELARAREKPAREARSDLPITKMNAKLRHECAKLKSQIASVEKNDIRGRHPIAIRLRKIRDRKKDYGEGAIEALAAELGHVRGTLYRWAKVADAWTTAVVIAKLLTRSSEYSLTWSHLEEIAQSTDAAERTTLVELVCNEGLTVREVRERIRTGVVQDDVPVDAADDVTLNISKMTRYAKRITMDQANWHDTLAKIARAPPKPGFVVSLKEAREACLRVQNGWSAILQEIDTVLRGADQVDASPVLPPAVDGTGLRAAPM